jgi:hypothetical protein
MAWLAVRTFVTVNENVLVAVAELASVTVTVNVVADSVAVGVPEIAPVVELIESPAGNVGEIE